MGKKLSELNQQNSATQEEYLLIDKDNAQESHKIKLKDIDVVNFLNGELVNEVKYAMEELGGASLYDGIQKLFKNVPHTHFTNRITSDNTTQAPTVKAVYDYILENGGGGGGGTGTGGSGIKEKVDNPKLWELTSGMYEVTSGFYYTIDNYQSLENTSAILFIGDDSPEQDINYFMIAGRVKYYGVMKIDGSDGTIVTENFSNEEISESSTNKDIPSSKAVYDFVTSEVEIKASTEPKIWELEKGLHYITKGLYVNEDKYVTILNGALIFKSGDKNTSCNYFGLGIGIIGNNSINTIYGDCMLVGGVWSGDINVNDFVDEINSDYPYNYNFPSEKAIVEFVQGQLNSLIDTAPDKLNTLNELANALNNDENFASTVMEQIGKKIDEKAITTEVSGNSTDDEIASAKAVYDFVNNISGEVDWNQNDPNGKGYIQNRPFYAIESQVTETFYDSTKGDPTATYVDDIGDNNEYYGSGRIACSPLAVMPNLDKQFGEGAELSYSINVDYSGSGDLFNINITGTETVKKYSDEIFYVGSIYWFDSTQQHTFDRHLIMYNTSTGEISIYLEGAMHEPCSGKDVTLTSTYLKDEIKRLDTKFINTSLEITEDCTNDKIPTEKAVYDFVSNNANTRELLETNTSLIDLDTGIYETSYMKPIILTVSEEKEIILMGSTIFNQKDEIKDNDGNFIGYIYQGIIVGTYSTDDGHNGVIFYCLTLNANNEINISEFIDLNDDFIKQEKISKEISNNSTDLQIPTAKAVYEFVSNNSNTTERIEGEISLLDLDTGIYYSDATISPTTINITNDRQMTLNFGKIINYNLTTQMGETNIRMCNGLIFGVYTSENDDDRQSIIYYSIMEQNGEANVVQFTDLIEDFLTKEDFRNKLQTTISSFSTDNEIPTAKAVFDYFSTNAHKRQYINSSTYLYSLGTGIYEVSATEVLNKDYSNILASTTFKPIDIHITDYKIVEMVSGMILHHRGKVESGVNYDDVYSGLIIGKFGNTIGDTDKEINKVYYYSGYYQRGTPYLLSFIDLTGDSFINKDQITQIINADSTHSQIPTAEAVYEKLEQKSQVQIIIWEEND